MGACRRLLPHLDLDGVRAGSCKAKLEKFKWEINYTFLIGRAITFPREAADPPPFKSFNTAEESF